MPTFKICVFEHQQRADGKFRVSIRLSHNRKSCYIATDTYVVRKQISKDFSGLRDTDTARKIDRDIIRYEKILLDGLGADLGRFSAKELADYIKKVAETEGGAGIDFVKFANDHISKLHDEGRKLYANRFEIVIRLLQDFFKRDIIFVKEINANNIRLFVKYLQQPRRMVRVNQLGRHYEITRPGLKNQTIADYLRILQTLFNAACDKYNDDDGELMIIKHNPFRKSFIEVTEEPAKRSLSIEDIRKILGSAECDGRMGMARDVLLLSFFFCGMNTADLFNVGASALSAGRLTYKRQKTATRRKDEALFSVKVIPEVEALLEKYRDPVGKKAFRFYRMYSDAHTFNSAVNKGSKQLAQMLGVNEKLSSYYMRHTFATIAANNCGFSDSDVGLALNHVGDGDLAHSKSLKVTRGYITRSWDKVDKIQRAVVDFVLKKEG